MENIKYFITETPNYKCYKIGEPIPRDESKEVSEDEYNKWTKQKYIRIDGKLFCPETKKIWETKHQEFEKESPGYLEFLDKLQVGKRIKFNGLKSRSKDSPPDYKKDVVIEIISREERGFMGRCPGCGGIEYASINDDGNFTELHSTGYFPCQTFTSMKDWFRKSDSYEILN